MRSIRASAARRSGRRAKKVSRCAGAGEFRQNRQVLRRLRVPLQDSGPAALRARARLPARDAGAGRDFAWLVPSAERDRRTSRLEATPRLITAFCYAQIAFTRLCVAFCKFALLARFNEREPCLGDAGGKRKMRRGEVCISCVLLPYKTARVSSDRRPQMIELPAGSAPPSE